MEFLTAIAYALTNEKVPLISGSGFIGLGILNPTHRSCAGNLEESGDWVGPWIIDRGSGSQTRVW